MKLPLTFLMAVLCRCVFAQSCSCLDDFHFVRDHIEKNHAGFNKKIKSPDEPAYKAFTENLEREIGKDKNGKYCVAYLKKYILYLQDHHSNITGNGGIVREDSLKAVAAFFQTPAYLNTETISINDKEVAEKLKDASGIEGIYYTGDRAYAIAIIKNKTDHRDYAGIILQSKSRLWSKGQVKLEIRKTNDSLFEVYTYLRNHTLSYDEIATTKGELKLPGWYKTGDSIVSQPAISTDLISFKILDSSTTLLSIRSFDASIYMKLDSAYKVIIPVIKKYPHLIIDVRNNGGGSDQSYSALMPLIYTDPFESDVVDIYNTPGNMKAYQDYDDKLKESAAARQGVFRSNIEKMKNSPSYAFVPMGNGIPSKVVYPRNSGKLEKIALLYNRYCASSCESLLFEVLNSRKTIMVGENSGGYTGYGNVMTVTTPCGNTLYWTTTAYRNQWKYEFVGIPPQFRVPEDEGDWVEYSRKLLNE